MNTPHTPSGPLAGLTVLDLTRVLSGPYCTMLAADMGARVIKVERPQRGDDTRAWGPPFLEGESAYYLSINRNKESLALDFTTTEGRDILDALIARSDVIVENFRPGTLEDRGLGYAALKAKHPGLIYVSLSGFGHTGPRREEAGYDAVLQAEGGLMSVTGSRDGEAVRLGVAIADIAGGMFAFQGLLLALIAKGRTGQGQHVDVSLLDATTALMTYQAGRYFATGTSPERLGNQHATIVPYDAFETAEGVLVLAVGNDDQFRRFCHLAGARELADDVRFATNAKRVEHHHVLHPVLLHLLASDTASGWRARLRAAGVPCGAVRSVGEALTDPQTLAREMVASVVHPTIGPLHVLGVPVKLSDTPGTVRTPPPDLGSIRRASWWTTWATPVTASTNWPRPVRWASCERSTIPPWKLPSSVARLSGKLNARVVRLLSAARTPTRLRRPTPSSSSRWPGPWSCRRSTSSDQKGCNCRRKHQPVSHGLARTSLPMTLSNSYSTRVCARRECWGDRAWPSVATTWWSTSSRSLRVPPLPRFRRRICWRSSCRPLAASSPGEWPSSHPAGATPAHVQTRQSPSGPQHPTRLDNV